MLMMTPFEHRQEILNERKEASRQRRDEKLFLRGLVIIGLVTLASFLGFGFYMTCVVVPAQIAAKQEQDRKDAPAKKIMIDRYRALKKQVDASKYSDNPDLWERRQNELADMDMAHWRRWPNDNPLRNSN